MRPQDLKTGDTVYWGSHTGTVQSIYGLFVNVKTDFGVKTVHVSKLRKTNDPHP